MSTHVIHTYDRQPAESIYPYSTPIKQGWLAVHVSPDLSVICRSADDAAELGTLFMQAAQLTEADQ